MTVLFEADLNIDGVGCISGSTQFVCIWLFSGNVEQLTSHSRSKLVTECERSDLVLFHFGDSAATGQLFIHHDCDLDWQWASSLVESSFNLEDA